MGSFINKIKRIWNNLANATKIRKNYHEYYTVRKRLKRVNFEILDCLLAIIGDTITFILTPEEYDIFEIPVFFIMVITLLWLLGYRNAIALGKTERETYIADSIRIMKTVCKILCKLIIAILIIILVIIVLLIIILNSGFISEVFPNLKEIIESISVRLDGVLGIVSH